MKRDLDLCRALMQAFEKTPAGQVVQTVALDYKTDAVTALSHIKLLIDAGLLEGESNPDASSPTGGNFFILSVTWAGHDFIGAANNNDVWSRTKKLLKKSGLASFDVLLEVLKKEAVRQIGGFLG